MPRKCLPVVMNGTSSSDDREQRPRPRRKHTTLRDHFIRFACWYAHFGEARMDEPWGQRQRPPWHSTR